MSPEYEWQQKTKWKMNENDEGRDTIVTNYGGSIEGLYCKGFDMVFYNSLKDVWFTPSRQPVPSDKLHGTIKCDAIFKYCE